MNAPAKIPLDFETIAQAMERNNIHQLRRWPAGRYSVELMDGSQGVGRSFREAIAAAKAGKVAA